MRGANESQAFPGKKKISEVGTTPKNKNKAGRPSASNFQIFTRK
jgi:hypothetical protein